MIEKEKVNDCKEYLEILNDSDIGKKFKNFKEYLESELNRGRQ